MSWQITEQAAGRGTNVYLRDARGVAIAQFLGGDRSADENASIRRLIAAAPEMLEALKAAGYQLTGIASESSDKDLLASCDDALHSIREAIAKAEGRE